MRGGRQSYENACAHSPRGLTVEDDFPLCGLTMAPISHPFPRLRFALAVPPTWAWPIVVLFGSVGTIEAQSTVTGAVVEEGTERGIASAEVRLVDSAGGIEAGTLTDDDGAFQFEADPGTYRFVVERLGYAPIESDSLELEEGQDVRIDVTMSTAAVPLDAVTVTVRRSVPIRIAEYRTRAEQSQRLGRGRVYMRDDIERLRPISAGALLAGFSWRGQCQPQILVDGLPPVENLSAIGPDDIEGIELYRGVNQIPPEYYRYGMCGLALIWLRADAPGARPLTWGRAIVAGVIVTLLLLISR
ncbi:MAG: DUF1416 domain-containing protein [Gemmatimonas sp.]|nr:DUF1416 domain-containing protein [Gemmatimonas sp.]